MAITLKYNNIPSESATSFVTFSDVPNLVEIDNDATGGTMAGMKITITGNWASASHIDPWFVSINGETITGVDDYKNAINKNFFIAPGNSSTAASMAKALRNCSSLAASFVISNVDNEVWLKARAKGQLTWNTETNATAYTAFNGTGGTVSDELIGGKVEVSVMDGGNNYITSLEKNYYESGIAFDVTPLLATMAEPGKTVPYNLQVNATKNNGEYISVGTISGNSIAQGYQVNQGLDYIPLNSVQNDFYFAQNVSRGKLRQWDNNMTLYVYGNTIPVSWYSKSLSAVTCQIQYLSSAYGVDHTETVTLSDSANGYLHNATVQLTNSYKTAAFYIKLTFLDDSTPLGTILYNVIKPLKAAETYQRILFRNSYGGVGFFDFTSTKSETRDLETTTYNKNVYDYYTQSVIEKEIPYDNSVKYSVTIKSHLIEKNGIYIFNDLLQSPEIWTEINGKTYRIILDNVSVDEQNNNDVYVATIKYKYSANPSL